MKTRVEIKAIYLFHIEVQNIDPCLVEISIICTKRCLREVHDNDLIYLNLLQLVVLLS